MTEGLRTAAVHAMRLAYRAMDWRPLGGRGTGAVYALNRWVAPRRPVVARLDGSRVALDLRERYSRGLYYRGTRLIEEYRTFCAHVHPGMTVIDVGANIGVFTLAAARRVGPQGRVISFEPLPRNYRYLVANLALNGYEQVSAEPMAVAGHDGSLELNSFSTDNLSVSPTVLGPEGKSTQAVPCVRLDTYLRERGIARVDLVKIDVEGAEASVLEGMGELLKREPRPALVMEVHPEFLEAVGRSTRDVLGSLQTKSYALWRVARRGATPIADPSAAETIGDPPGGAGAAPKGKSRRFRVYAEARPAPNSSSS